MNELQHAINARQINYMIYSIIKKTGKGKIRFLERKELYLFQNRGIKKQFLEMPLNTEN